MKKTFKFFAAALAIVAAASCAKEINDTKAEQEQEKFPMTFIASLDSEADTKTSLGNNGLVEWTAGDKVTLYGNGKYNSTDGYNRHKGYCTIDAGSISDDKSLASFSGDVASSADYCALYPADGWKVNTSIDYKYEFVGFADQKAVKNSFDPSKHVMVAGYVDGTRFSFKNICALAKVNIATDGIYSIKVEGYAQYGTSGNYGSIGGPYGWKVNKTLFEYSPRSGNEIHSIIVKNENGAALENGATYYVVLPACTISNYTVSVCDENGVVIGSKSKASDFVVERSKVYNMGSFDNTNVMPAESLTVNKTSLSLTATNAFDFITISSNRNWTVTSNVEWITFNQSSGEPASNVQIMVRASDNTAYTSRTATLTIKGENEVKTVTVTQAAAPKPQTYKVVKSVHVDELVDGKKYVVRLQGDSNKYWTNSDGKLVLTALTNGEIRKENVVIYTFKANDDNKVTNYKAERVCTWKSLSSNLSLDDDFKFSTNSSVWMTLANRWGSDTGYDVDIYKNGTNNFLYCNSSGSPAFGPADNSAAGWNGNTYRKWYIYEVTEE